MLAKFCSLIYHNKQYQHLLMKHLTITSTWRKTKIWNSSIPYARNFLAFTEHVDLLSQLFVLLNNIYRTFLSSTSYKLTIKLWPSIIPNCNDKVNFRLSKGFINSLGNHKDYLQIKFFHTIFLQTKKDATKPQNIEKKAYVIQSLRKIYQIKCIVSWVMTRSSDLWLIKL